VKLTFLSAVIIGLLSILLLVFGNFEMHLYFYGIYFLEMIGIFPVQLLFSLGASNMVMASSVRKRLLTSVPAVLTSVSMMLCYLASALIMGGKLLLHPEGKARACMMLLSSAAIMAGIMLYTAIAYKYFVLATVLFAVSVAVMLNIGSPDMLLMLFPQMERVAFSYPVVVLLGLGAIAAGGGLEYLLTLLVYRAPLSKQAQVASLRRQM